jgi:hypothetical protein
MKSELNEMVKQKNQMDDLLRAVDKYEVVEMERDQTHYLDKRIH